LYTRARAAAVSQILFSYSIRSLIAARVEDKKYTLKERRDQTFVMASWSVVKRRPKFTVLQAQYLAFIQT
jgi:hypothetical protein